MSNWYPRYYGDYMRDTAHLTLTEHGAYGVLLDHYYATRNPLPAEEDKVFRICRAFTDEERDAVRSVLTQFFPVNGDGSRRNKRADKEMAKESAISKARAKAGLKGAHGKWDGKRMANATTSTTTSTTREEQPHGAGAPETRARGDDDLKWTESDCIKAAEKIGIPAVVAKTFFAHYAPVNFVDGAGRAIRSLPHALQKWYAKEPSHGKQATGSGLSILEQADIEDAAAGRVYRKRGGEQA